MPKEPQLQMLPVQMPISTERLSDLYFAPLAEQKGKVDEAEGRLLVQPANILHF